MNVILPSLPMKLKEFEVFIQPYIVFLNSIGYTIDEMQLVALTFAKSGKKMIQNNYLYLRNPFIFTTKIFIIYNTSVTNSS